MVRILGNIWHAFIKHQLFKGGQKGKGPFWLQHRGMVTMIQSFQFWYLGRRESPALYWAAVCWDHGISAPAGLLSGNRLTPTEPAWASSHLTLKAESASSPMKQADFPELLLIRNCCTEIRKIRKWRWETLLHKRDQNGNTVCCWFRALPGSGGRGRGGLEVCLSVCTDCEKQRKKDRDHCWEFCYSSTALFSKVIL